MEPRLSGPQSKFSTPSLQWFHGYGSVSRLEINWFSSLGVLGFLPEVRGPTEDFTTNPQLGLAGIKSPVYQLIP